MRYKYSTESGISRIKTNAKKYAVAGIASLTIIGSLAMPALAAKPATVPAAAPKATGGVGYTAYSSVQRNAEFNAHQTSTSCSTSWNVSGNYNLGFNLTGDPTVYTHDASLNQTGTVVSGTGGYPAGGSHVYEWLITSGSAIGSTITFQANYTLGADATTPLTTMTVTGTIASNGTMSGTWTDNYLGGSRSGQWSTSAGAATTVYTSGCTGKGNFNYSDADGNWYRVDVQYVKVDGNQTWFAGPVTSGNVGAGNWLFVKVSDGDTPGRKGDQIWGSFATEAASKVAVATMGTPADGPFAITSGNLVVHN